MGHDISWHKQLTITKKNNTGTTHYNYKQEK